MIPGTCRSPEHLEHFRAKIGDLGTFRTEQHFLKTEHFFLQKQVVAFVATGTLNK